MYNTDKYIEIQKDALNEIKYIRSFDLGGSGLKTALFCYNKQTKIMNQVSSNVKLGMCPDNMEVADWIRLQFKQILNKDLDDEVIKEYAFGFSLAGLDKLRSAPFTTDDISILFKLPRDKVIGIDDGAAHLIASLHDKNLNLPKGCIWNF